MIDNVLIAVEDDEERMVPVIEHASEVAAGVSATVTLYHVYSPGEFENLLDARGQESADPSDVVVDNTSVEAAAEILRDAGLEFTVEATTGDPSEAIISRVENSDVDHVFLGGGNRSPTGKVLLGSVSQSVILNTDVPCTVVG